MAKMDAEAKAIVLMAVMKLWDLRVCAVKLYTLDKRSVDSNRTMNKTTG